MALSTTLGSGSPERLQAELPKDFFAKPTAMASGALQLVDDLDFARASGAEIVAGIIPAAVRLPNINALSDKTRTPKPAVSIAQKPATAPPLKTPVAVVAAAEEPQQEIANSTEQVPFLLPPIEESYDVDAAINRAAAAAQQTARDAQASSAQSRPPSDYRALLPQGPMVAAPPLPLGSARAVTQHSAAPETGGITTFALDAPLARDRNRAAPDQGKRVTAAQQQFFALLTARLKATNQRLLAEAVKAGPRTTVRMKFLLDRNGRVLQASPAEPVNQTLAERAIAVIRAAPLPPVPETMTQVPVELSFPVEVYQ